ncbi:MAG: penicillin acylase family protein [candidate division KSB1 bacterium]|nr:penicillin acylase family protein [candidate division KSB1 bacterium]MDZ7273687.1 penicillin acylase family protein [candidate division KSB1 bacterium]MDZ7285843.1 penicillin acylase family protein [candidate division KSB1 bacterium]MDZ7298875.1 penicillin acylase family protein [candidate division KSB1 bacterium]MDZ7307079.1 penicillin acylase family protein [candidate division KSB1 bacterium]
MAGRHLLVDTPWAKIRRDAHGVPHVEAREEVDLYWSMGYCHARDRGLQMLLTRLLGRGRASEFLASSEAMLEMDLFFRRMNWGGNLEAEIAKLSPAALEACLSYCEGANDYFSQKIPWEFKLLGGQPEPWRPEDIILLCRMTGYLTLAQSQGEIERLLIEMVQANLSLTQLEELFPGQLNGLEVELIKKVKLGHRLVPAHLVWQSGLPKMMASNNWVIAGRRTASGQPMLANDPHLEANRLPNVWYEMVLKCGTRYALGATMPGLPGILLGRSNDLAWGATYSFMDAIDSWIEHCKEGRYRRNRNDWVAFRQRREVIKRRKKAPVEVIFYENDHGVLDGDPQVEGYYLATRWSGAQTGAQTINHIIAMWSATAVEEGREHLGQIEVAFNWVLADRHGNIGYQMSGLMPKRRVGVSGLVPLPGWKPENDWAGFVDYRELPRCLNPAAGYFVTANHNLNDWGVAKPINIAMGAYRAERIAEMIESQSNLTPADLMKMQYDVHSVQAERFLQVLHPVLPPTLQGRILADWDCDYTTSSQGAYLFEQFYHRLLQEVFGGAGWGTQVAAFLAEETALFVDFYANFDAVLLAENSAWFGGRSREEIFRRVAEAALTVMPKPWGEVQQLELRHLLFGDKLPRLLGFDRGPVPLRGGRATPHQGQIYRSAGRQTSFAPSFRMIADLSREMLYTNLAGGPSDRRFSKWYCADLKNWRNGVYKFLQP